MESWAKILAFGKAIAVLAVTGCFIGLPVDGRSGGKQRTQPGGPHRVGVIIALGAGHTHEGKPSYEMVQRVGTAVAAYRAGRAKYILFCGGYTSGHIAEAEEMKIMAIALGVPERFILVENGSMSTLQNARNAQTIIDRKRFRSALLVTHKSHMARAFKAFREIKRLRKIYRVFADDYVPPDISLRTDQELPPFGEIQAVIVHGKSVDVDFRSETVTLDRTQLSLARTMAWLYQKGLTAPPYYVWHKACAVGHITKSEIIGLAAIGLGMPAKVLYYGPARRYAPNKKGLFDLCRDNGWKRVLAILPADREEEQELIEQQYAESGITATVILAEE